MAGTRFYERREVKDILAYLRLIHNPCDSVSLLRIINVPQRGIGQRTLDGLSQWARSQGITEYRALQIMDESKEGEEVEHQLPFSPRITKTLADFARMIDDFTSRSREMRLVELFDLVVESSGYKRYISGLVDGEDRWENLLELRTVIQEYNDLKPMEGLASFLEGVALVSDVDGLDRSVDAATLITLHQAKGLEFPVVFIVGLEEGLLPHFRSLDDPVQLEEERRLCYVGITRAEKRVYLLRAFRRRLMGSSSVNKPSRFLQDIPSRLLSGGDVRSGEESQVAKAVYSWNRDAAPNVPDFEVPELKTGDHVRHGQFGEGVVVSCRVDKDDAEVVIVFDGAGLKKLLLSFAKLEKV